MPADSPSRRRFLSGLTLAAAAAPAVSSRRAEAAFSAPEGSTVGGFHLGVQCWTFRNFSVLEAIEFTGRAGGSVIEFFPGQKLRPDDEDARWNHESPDEAHSLVKDKLEEWGVTPMNYGVVGIPEKEDEARAIFEFAKRWNLYGITTESDRNIDLVEKLAVEYDIRICYHNHPRRPDNPDYKVWDPAYIAELVKDRDPRVGACGDTGHWIRTGLDPVESLQILEGRVHALHLKDRPDKEGADVVWGSGIGRVEEVLSTVRDQGFAGNISVEYETNWDHNFFDAAQCLGFVRGVSVARGWT